MLPKMLRYWLFDTLSVQTMRYVSAVPNHKAEGLTKRVYDMIREDFFKNGSLTSRSQVPELMAAIWTGGRESMLVADKVDRTTKDAISAVLSQMNDCPYCEDMLVSLVHAGGEHEAAGDIFAQNGLDATDETLRRRLEWVRAIAAPGLNDIPATSVHRRATTRDSRDADGHERHQPLQSCGDGGLTSQRAARRAEDQRPWRFDFLARNWKRPAALRSNLGGRFRFCRPRLCPRTWLGRSPIPASPTHWRGGRRQSSAKRPASSHPV